MQNQPADAPVSVEHPHVCPWWIGYLLASPVRRIFYPPSEALDGHIQQGMTVLEPGPGMGFFTLELARRVGQSGRVVAVDVQARMLKGLQRRAAKAGLLERMDIRQATADSLGIADLEGRVDFTLAFAVVHELPSPALFFREVARASKMGARLLFAEPKGHVPPAKFAAELQTAREAGFTPVDVSLAIHRSHGVLLEKAKL